MDTGDDGQQQDICRVCRSEATPDKPLYHPCICTGSIKFIHQECLVQWLKYSKKEYCELCNHRFSFMPRVMLAKSVNILLDTFYGCCIVSCTLCAFIALIWLREQIIHGAAPEWLEQPNAIEQQQLPQEILQGADERGGGEPIGGGGDGVIEGGAAVDHEARHPQVGGAIMDEAAIEALPQLGGGGGGEPDDLGGAMMANQAPVEPAAQDDINWNPMEWDRAPEDLTWERLLGLDGSLVFLEHVFWVISLNTMCIVVFAFFPYHIGDITSVTLRFKEHITASHFEGLITTLVGYIVIGVGLIVLHGVASVARFRRTRRLLGVCYIVVKVSLLTVVEIGLFPLICGWWLDICSMSLFGNTLQDLIHNFNTSPGTSMFIRWLVGMVYVFYFASFIILLREILRPGVLWFLQNFNDPEFHPIQEMIQLPVHRHVRRFALSLIIFGTAILLMVWVPLRIIRRVLPTFLPYNVAITSDLPTTEFSLELILLQVVFPAILEQGHTKQFIKFMLRVWCIAVSYVLGLRSYLLGDEDEAANDDHAEENAPPNRGDVVEGGHEEGVGGAAGENVGVLRPLVAPMMNLGEEHQALVIHDSRIPEQPYIRPSFFPLRIFLLLVLTGISVTISSLCLLTIPVWIGRELLTLAVGTHRMHEFYTGACGFYTCWLLMRCLALVFSWMPRGWNAIMEKFESWLILSLKSVTASMMLLGVIPLLMGIHFDLVIIVPLRVPLNATPIFYLWHDWALGVLHAKILCALTLMGPNWRIKRALEQVYQDGVRRMNLKMIITELVLPVSIVLSLSLAVPYIFARSILPLLGVSFETENLVWRRIYPCLVAVVVITVFIVFQARQFCRLYEHIKNDKYLVGRRLVNYEPSPRHSPAPARQQQSATAQA